MYYLRYKYSRIKHPNYGSIMSKLLWKKSVPVPGNIYDYTDRGQVGRFNKWYNLPETAHRLYWRFHENKPIQCQASRYGRSRRLALRMLRSGPKASQVIRKTSQASDVQIF